MRVEKQIPELAAGTTVALGLFDGIHKAHAAVIRAAAEAGKELGLPALVLTFRPEGQVMENKPGFRAILSEEQKLEQIAELGIDTVVCPMFREIADLPAQVFFHEVLVGKLRARSISCGYDYTFGKGAAGSVEMLQSWCEKAGISLRIQPRMELRGDPISSTRIRELLAEGDIPAVNEQLGYPYYLMGKVVHGRKLGRTLGFPTLNQLLPEYLALPRFGVYSSTTFLAGKSYASITNLGVKPTISGERLPLAETHLLGAEGDFYGLTAKVYLHSLTRTERKFNSLQELRHAIELDIAGRNDIPDSV